MGSELITRVHAAALTARRGQRGQGTVEYVGLILLVGLLLAAVVAAMHGFKGTTSIGSSLVDTITKGIQSVTGGKS